MTSSESSETGKLWISQQFRQQQWTKQKTTLNKSSKQMQKTREQFDHETIKHDSVNNCNQQQKSNSEEKLINWNTNNKGMKNHKNWKCTPNQKLIITNKFERYKQSLVTNTSQEENTNLSTLINFDKQSMPSLSKYEEKLKTLIGFNIENKFFDKSIYFWLAFESYCFRGHA